MKLEQVIKRPVSEQEADSIVKVLEGMGQKKTAEHYRRMIKKWPNCCGAGKRDDREAVKILSSRQKILSGMFHGDSREFMEPICRYLFLSRDIELHAGIMEPGHSLEECLKHVFDNARKLAGEQHSEKVAVMDMVVYGWVKEYFLKENDGNGKQENRMVMFAELGKKQPEKKAGAKRPGKKAGGKKAAGMKKNMPVVKNDRESPMAEGKESNGKDRGNEHVVQMSLFDMLGAKKG